MRLRWIPALVTSLPVPLLLGIALGLTIHDRALGIPIAVLAAALLAGAQLYRVRLRTLTILGDGLEVQRDSYALHIPWDSITGLQHRRAQGVLPVDELTFTDASLIARDSRGRPAKPPAKLSQSAALHRVQVSLYDARWEQGPIGDQLRGRRIIT